MDLGMIILDLISDLPQERVEPRDTYGMVIRTENDRLELKSGFDFSPRTIQKIFEAVARAKGAHPHMKIADSRGQRTDW